MNEWVENKAKKWEDLPFIIARLQDVLRSGVRGPPIYTERYVKRVRLSIVLVTSRAQILARRRTARYFISISIYIPRQHIKLGHERFLLQLFHFIQELLYL